MRRWWVPVMVGLFILVALTGCSGSRVGRHVSWPGMSIVNGTVYAANLERVVALDAATGKWLWSYPNEEEKSTVGPFYSSPVLAEGVGDYGVLLIAGFNDKTVYALRLGASPAERPDDVPAWSFTGAQGQYVGSGTIAGDLFLIGNGDGKVYALDIASGNKVWEFATKDRVWATPLVVDGMVYIASLDHHLYAVDLESGSEVWQVETKGSIAATPIYVNNHVWVGDFGKTLYQIAPDTGHIVWTYTVQDWLWSTPVSKGAVLFFADVGGHIYALNTETREFVWDTPAMVDDAVHARPVFNADQSALLVAGFEKGGIHEIDVETGVIKMWDLSVEKGRLPGDLTADNERLYLMPILLKDRVQALDILSGSVEWVYPPTEN
ncbi:MAG: PQQ-binding-like beta-propeller repeat protein [Anaerolineae bacterium]|nr:PQQ-binding-like beta-propeller repeat protein [Anaerolineae bacterium]